MRLLVVEDNEELAELLMRGLEAENFDVDHADTAEDASEALRDTRYAAVILDLGLPDRDGLSLIADIRQRGATPIVVLSARDAEAMKVQALDLGADDYVQKPFGVDELLARIRAGLRHGVQMRGSEPVVRTGDLEIDLGRRSVCKGGEPLRLSPKEYGLLCELALNLGRTLTHRQLLGAVWGSEHAEIQYLRVYVGQLRQKVGAEMLSSEPGVGYRLESRAPVDGAASL